MKKFLHLGFLIGCQIQMLFAKKMTLKKFKEKYSTIILKPLDGMGGESIYKFDESSNDHLTDISITNKQLSNYGHGSEFLA